MDFLLRILFSGLMVFVPSEDGTELDVLLLNVDHSYHSSDNTTPGHHKAIVVTRAGSCTGTCPTRDAEIAQFFFPDQSAAVALDSFEAAVAGGGGWVLNGAQLALRKGSTNAPALPALTFRDGVRTTVIPTTSTEREDYSWLASLKAICGTPCEGLNPAVLAAQPPSGLVAARFRLKSGKVFTYSVAKIGSNVTPVHFKRLDGQGSVSPYSQAVATWMGADVEISGENVEIVETNFDGTAGRTMKLAPDANDRVEVAVLNLPPFVPSTTPFTGTPDPGKHFERFYDVLQTPPAEAARMVPYPGPADPNATYPQVTWQSVHPQSLLYSSLLTGLRIDIGRGISEPLLCPPSKVP
ncbi:MAG TPA: hypothetical protein VF883_00715 [Thermoanaerobaculia bacterium]|jgi:hypothetical protein